MNLRPTPAQPTAPRQTPFAPAFTIGSRAVLGIFTIFMLLSSLWALATPLMGVPDEPAHTIRAAAVARGEIVGRIPNADTFKYPRVQVPEYIAQTTKLACFAGQPQKPADCEITPTDDDTLVSSSSSAASNNPLYYAVVGLPSLILDGAPALYAMRMMSGFLCSLLLTAMTVALVRQSRSWWPAVAGVVAVTPMVLFLSGAINPNAVEMASAGALLATVSLMLRTDLGPSQLWRQGVIAVLSTFALMSGRSLALLWLAIIAVVLVPMVPWSRIATLLRSNAVRFTLAGMAVAAVGMLVWFALGFTAVDPSGADPHRPPGIPAVFLITMEATFDSWLGWIGQFGWMDYPAPGGVQVVWHAAIVALVFSGLVLGRGRMRVALIIMAAATLLVPPVVQSAMFNQVGWLWQGRYALPVYMCLLLVAGLALDDAFPRTPVPAARRLIRAGFVVIAASQIATFVFVLRRYVVANQSWTDMLRDPIWQPPLGWIGLTLLTTAVWAAAATLVFRWTKQPELPAASETPSGTDGPVRAKETVSAAL